MNDRNKNTLIIMKEENFYEIYYFKSEIKKNKLIYVTFIIKYQ
jgi:hypothetical protein